MSPRRQLVLLRHAKAEPGLPDQDDHERALARRGRRDAKRIGRAMAEHGLAPEQVLCSSARRTRETLERILPHLPTGLVPSFDRRLYLASPDEIVERIAEVENDAKCLLVVGHNPGLGALAIRLSGRGRSEQLNRMRQKFPTAALAEIEVDAPLWRDLVSSDARLAWFLTPSDVAGEGG